MPNQTRVADAGARAAELTQLLRRLDGDMAAIVQGHNVVVCGYPGFDEVAARGRFGLFQELRRLYSAFREELLAIQADQPERGVK